MEERILISEEDLGHEVKSIKSRWQRTIITKWFLRHVLPSRIDPQTKRTTILKLKGFIRGLKIPNIDTGKLQTVRKCLHNRSKGLLGSRAVTNLLPLDQVKRFIVTIGPYPVALKRAGITPEEKRKAQRDLATVKAGPDKIHPMFNI